MRLITLVVLVSLMVLFGCGGGSNNSVPPPPTVRISVSPTVASVMAGATQQFTATVTGTSNTAVTWTATGGGVVDGNGKYTAPPSVPSPSTATVTATSNADPSRKASAQVMITAVLDFTLTVSPGAVTVEAGRTSVPVSFSATAENGFASSISVTVSAPSGIAPSPVSFSYTPGASQPLPITFAVGSAVSASSYTATFTATSGTLMHAATVTIIVTAPSLACTLSASPAAIMQGQSATLSWTTQGATFASIDQGIGNVGLPSGSLTVAPAVTTTYTLTVKGGVTVQGAGVTCQATITVTAPAWTVGNGSITGLAFSSRIPTADRTDLTKRFNDAYPVMLQIFGAPPDTFTLNIDLCGWSYSGAAHQLCIAVLPTTLNASSQSSFSLNFYREMAGAFLHSEHAGTGPNWVGEGMPYAVSFLTLRILIEEGIRPGDAQLFGAELDYPVLSLAGREVVGGVPGKVWKGGGEAVSLSDTSGLHLFLILAATQSQATARDWRRYTALKSLKEELYLAMNAKQGPTDVQDLLAAVRTRFANPIEGLNPADWVTAQPIAYTSGTPGGYLYVRPFPAANPTVLSVVAFSRSSQEVVPGVLRETQATSGTVTITVTKAGGAVVQILTLDLSNPKHSLNFDTTAYLTGGYRIQASGTVDGVSTTAPSSYFGIYDKTLVPGGQDVGTLTSALFLIGRNADRTVSQSPFPALAGGVYLQDIAGAAVWKSNASTIPARVTILGRELYLPLPFSPVFILANP